MSDPRPHREGCMKPLGRGYDILCGGCGDEVAAMWGDSLRGKLYRAEVFLAAAERSAAEARAESAALRERVSALEGALRQLIAQQEQYITDEATDTVLAAARALIPASGSDPGATTEPNR